LTALESIAVYQLAKTLVAPHHLAATDTVSKNTSLITKLPFHLSAFPPLFSMRVSPKQEDKQAGVVNDAGKTNLASDPPSGPNQAPSIIRGPIDIDYAALGPEQGKLVKLLDDRGAVEGLIDNSTGVDVKIMELAGVIHDERDKIIDFLLTDCEQGMFRRKTLQEYFGKKRSCIR
jgi:hypothetical protein